MLPSTVDGAPGEAVRTDPSGDHDAASREDSDDDGGVSARELNRRRVEHGLGRLLLGGFLGSLAVLLGARYLWWRLETLPGTGWLGIGFYGVELAHIAAFALLVPLLVRIRRQRARSRIQGPPTGSLDVFIPVCGEPIDMVERTLRAALAIEYPHRTYLLNDGRLAGKPNWREVERLADRYGVDCLTRRSGRPGKAGNLNHGLAHSDGDFVLAVDADHRVSSDAAAQTLGYFADPGIAFVCTPQSFRVDGADHLHNRELFFYWGIQPARDADGCAFSCGNGAVYRRAALWDVGGFSEWNLVEDLHTSYELHAKGWRSVYHRRPLSLGEAPQTPAAFVKQRLTWATDGLRLLLWDSPIVKPGLGLADRLHYLHNTGHYVLACLHLVFAAGPLLYIFWGQSVMKIDSVAEYAWQIAPFLVAVFATLAAYSGWRGMLGTVQNILFLGPVAVVALLRARTLSRRRLFSGVTPKVGQAWFSPLLTPQALLLGALVAGVATVVLSPRRTELALAGFWAAWMALLLAGPLLTSVRPLARRVRAGALTALAACMVGFVGLSAGAAGAPPLRTLLLGERAGSAAVDEAAEVAARERPVEVPAQEVALHGELPGRGGVAAVACAPGTSRRLAVPEDGAYLGVLNEEVADSDAALERWETRTGVDVAISHWYQQWDSGYSQFRTEWLEQTREQGAVPMISWEPWDKPEGGMHDAEQPEMRLQRIADGAFDDYVREWARQAAAYGEPLLLRPMHEMNGWWYPWSVGENDNSPRDFVTAWRHVHSLFEEAGADNVSWVWSVNTLRGLDETGGELDAYYPGEDVVDWVGVSAFNWGDSSEWSSWSGFEEAHGETLDALAEFDKPVMVAEVGSVQQGGDEAVWVNEALESLASRSAVKAVVWFDRNYPGAPDFRLRDEEASVLARRAGSSGRWLDDPAVVDGQDADSRGADRRHRPTCSVG